MISAIRYYVAFKAAGVPIGLAEVIGMALRRSLTADFAAAILAAHQLNVGISRDVLEAHSLAGGNAAAIVKAAAELSKVGEPVATMRLAALDLRGGAVIDLTASFAQLKAQFPTLTFAEYVDRALEGEDVMAAAARGDFVPRDQQKGWRARVTFGPMSGSEMASLIASGKLPADAMVQEPADSGWLPLTEAARKLGIHLKGGL